MCMKCGCGKKAGQKGYGKGNPKKMSAKSSMIKKPMKRMSRGK
jgi:hypothetical protein